MAATRFRCVRAAAGLAAGCATAAVLAGTWLAPVHAVAGTVADRPVVWFDDDRRPIPEPAEREPNLLWDGPRESFKRPVARLLDPVRFVRRVGTIFGGDHVPPAGNVNALDEVPNSSWFTNRIGLFPMSAEEVGRGPGSGSGPDRSGIWTVIKAKSEGVTPGFNIRDGAGNVFVIKFDPAEHPNISSAAGVISGLLLHACGYNVPDDSIVRFRREDLRLGEGVKISVPGGGKRPMTVEDLDAILASVPRRPDGSWRAVASRFLSGKPLGPFDYKGTRDDDPNDRIPHQDRRELRGLRMVAAWINHFDTKQHNSLDMFVATDGGGYVKHHLIDFASTLGTGALGPAPMQGREYSFDGPAIFGRLVALGFHEDRWRRVRRPEGLDEIGYFQSEHFDPLEFKPLVPNPAFANFTDRDGYWAAKIISAFTDEHLLAVVDGGRYENPEATTTMARILGERRDKIARLFFDRIAPLEYFRLDEGGLQFRDLGAERGIYPGTTPRYRVRFASADASGPKTWSGWLESDAPRVSMAGAVPAGGNPADPFLAVQAQVDRGSGWSGTITATVSRRLGRVVAMDR